MKQKLQTRYQITSVICTPQQRLLSNVLSYVTRVTYLPVLTFAPAAVINALICDQKQ